MKKYFSSSTLKALSILSPESWTSQKLDFLKKTVETVGEKFNNVIEI